MLERVQFCAVWRRTLSGQRLQLTDSARNIGHCPLVVQVDVRLWFTPRTAQVGKLDLDVLRGGAQAEAFSNAVTHKLNEYASNMGRAAHSVDVNGFWTGLNQAVLHAAHSVFPAQPVIKGVVERERTVELRHKHAAARRELLEHRGCEVEPMLIERCKILRRAYLRSRHRDFQHMREQLALQIREAIRRGDVRTAWKQSRRLAGTGIGPKCRCYKAVSVAPCLNEWIDVLRLDGPQGGMLAVPYARGDEHDAPFTERLVTSPPLPRS
eukprot:6469050-Amphidinium_carterae.1